MSRDPDQQHPLSSSSTSSSVLASSSSLSTAPRIQSSGLPSFANVDTEKSSTGDRLRLPPLHSLISSSSGQSRSSPSPVSSPHAGFYPHQDWSPSKSHPSTSLDVQSFLQSSEKGESSGINHSKSDKFLSIGKGSLGSSHDTSRQHGPPPLRRSNSSTSTTTTASLLNLPPLNALHIRQSSLSPSEPPSHQPPRLPIQSSSARSRPNAISSSYTEDSIGPIRRRYTGESTSTTPYSRPSPPSDAEYFNHVSHLQWLLVTIVIPLTPIYFAGLGDI